MRGVKAFLVWLFSFWTWCRACFMARWFKAPPSDQGRVDSSVGVEQLRSNEVQHESALAAFLFSVPEDRRLDYASHKDGFRLSAFVDGDDREFLVDEATHREFLVAIASSKLESRKSIWVGSSGRSFDTKQMEEIVGALVSNNNFEDVSLDFSGCSALQMAECVSNLLSGNKAIKDLVYVGLDESKKVGKEAAELLANGLRDNQVLRNLNLRGIKGFVDDEAVKVLIEPLKDNDSVLQYLRFRKLGGGGLEHLGVMLGTNTSLKTLGLNDLGKDDQLERRDEVYVRGYTSLSKGLCTNQSLKQLICTVASSTELKVLLEPLMPMNNNSQANTTLTYLLLWNSRIGGKEGVDILADMIRTNTSLLKLHLGSMRELDEDNLNAVKNVVAILEALKANKSLKVLGLWDCGGVGGYEVLGTMMDMLLENCQLEEIHLVGTPLESSADAKYVHFELERRKKMQLWDLIKGMANVSPKSGRVFLCGHPRAGKTTLRMSMKGLPEFQNKKASRLSFAHHGKRRLRDKFMTPKLPKVCATKPEIERTRGIEVDHVKCDGIGISIWDMAGQAEYHSFHDLVIPNLSADGSCSLFLLTCNPMQENSLQKRNISDIKAEVEYWLQFIASNTRRSWRYRPHVSIVMTHHDHWSTEDAFEHRIRDVVAELKLHFEEVLEFDPKRELFMVNGEDKSCAGMVFAFIKTHLKQLLQRLPKTLKACSEVQRLLTNWNQEISQQMHGGQASKLPMMNWEEFSDTICKGVEELQDDDKALARRKQEFVAISLNDGGHIMYHEEGKFVITNPHWFCHDIMGEFLHRCANVDAKLEMVSYGKISTEHVKQILMNVMEGQGHEDLTDAILSMMKKLHICYEQDDKTIMIPSTLQDKRKRLSWLPMPQSKKLTHVGRRLSCKDSKRTMLSLGFFPRLQVSFFQKFQYNNVGNSYQVLEDVIMFICDGIEVIIEFDHMDVDIMLRSERCHDQMLEFVENGIVRHIQDMLQNPTLGCPGVILVEHILRPRCVEELVDMKDRKVQFVSREELELEVITRGFDAAHNWKECGHLKRGFDKIKDLLGNKAWAKLLKKRFEDLERYQNQILRVSDRSSQNESLTSEKRMDSTWTSTIWHTLQKPIKLMSNCRNPILYKVYDKLDNIDHKTNKVYERLDKVDHKMDVVIRKVDDILQMQENIVKMQNDLLQEVSSRIEGLMELSIKMQLAQVPKLAYLSEVGHKKLLTRFVLGLEEFQLHLMCESRDGVHEVVDQEGCKVNFGTSGTRVFMTMLVWGLKVATILTKIGAHVAGGMGGMVPDLGEGLQLTGLVVDTPGLMDQTSAWCLKSLPDNVKESPRITKDDRSNAEEWLMEVLEAKCKEKSSFYQMFRLKKVVYRGVGSGKVTIVWLCDHCEKNGSQSEMLYNS